MAYVYQGSTIVVTGSGDNTIPGPVDIIGMSVLNTTTISKNGTVVVTVPAGTKDFKFRSAGDITINGSCVLYLRLKRVKKTRDILGDGGTVTGVGNDTITAYDFNLDYNEDFYG